ncbi:hypothetical protein [Photobacterium atrarenae]|uniref:EAL domain-containing protein n=1 Tax=Photobacterium atrarenae TaxID=865757 RepID=A0ABY5GGN2_9GAMM|nr:hypothetical protein [Photobacterium atrarenae]UTV28447.1 hypothetical protein NNL38_04155 [Photobacterium atrarenae]
MLAKEDVFIFEDIHAERSSEVIFSLLTQGFIYLPVSIEANDVENARICFHNRYQWADLTQAFQSKQVLRC